MRLRYFRARLYEISANAINAKGPKKFIPINHRIVLQSFWPSKFALNNAVGMQINNFGYKIFLKA